mmetsp:Transcript_774/g.1687  ORF Transcript_774/g.1687 Transcript_774/m.1687 type:complete len:145 (-) Transcript_774:106-540(-)
MKDIFRHHNIIARSHQHHLFFLSRSMGFLLSLIRERERSGAYQIVTACIIYRNNIRGTTILSGSLLLWRYHHPIYLSTPVAIPSSSNHHRKNRPSLQFLKSRPLVGYKLGATNDPIGSLQTRIFGNQLNSMVILTIWHPSEVQR